LMEIPSSCAATGPTRNRVRTTISAMVMKAKNRWAAQDGMTLVEIMVVMAIIAVIIMATAGGLGGIFEARLSATANKMSGMVRYGYNLASLRGKVHRLVIDIDGGTYHIEEVEPAQSCALVDEDTEKEARTAGSQEVSGSKVEDKRVKSQKMPEGVRVSGIYTKHNSRPVEEGSESIYFFPDGTAEKAFIWLTDEDVVFTLEVTALKGTGIVHPEELDAKELKKR
jgi:prepilin-type N-terminal cleavage/methylation domain-containing protein